MSTTGLHLHQHVYVPMCTFIHAKTTIHIHTHTLKTHTKLGRCETTLESFLFDLHTG